MPRWHPGNTVQPEVIAPILPNEGFSIPLFLTYTYSYPMLFNWGSGLVETVESILDKHPYFDEYWQSKIPDLAKIKVPAYIICSWGDQGIHTRGTLNAWKAISSAQKWLEIHQYQK